MNTNLVFFGLLLILAGNGTITSTQTFLLLTLLTTVTCPTNNNSLFGNQNTNNS